MWAAGINETCRLLTVDVLGELTMEEGIFYVKLVHGPVAGGGEL